MDRDIVVIAHNIRSAHNIGALFRTCEGLGIKKLYLSGYSPYPKRTIEDRLPHTYRKLTAQIQKVSLGAEATLNWQYVQDIQSVLETLAQEKYIVAALEQTPMSQSIQNYLPPKKIAIIIGSEVSGVDPSLLKKSSIHLEIPMLGKKESFNVVEAAAMALFRFRFAK